MSLIKVLSEVPSLKRILNPTRSPTEVLSSSAKRLETERAANRRGCVCPIKPRTPRPISRHILGNCVDLPEPVSPAIITTWFSEMAFLISSTRSEIGRSGYSITGSSF